MGHLISCAGEGDVRSSPNCPLWPEAFLRHPDSRKIHSGATALPEKRSKIYDVEFHVVWNASRRTFDVEQDGKPTGSFAQDKSTAIGLASRAAQFENREGRTAAVYAKNTDGKIVVEWSA